MATLRELYDPLSNEVDRQEDRARPRARDPRRSRTESLILKTSLTPTDYAEAWALTHYLAIKRGPDFVEYLKSLGRIPPLEPRTPEQQLALFREFFPDDLVKLDKKVDDYIRTLSRTRRYDPLPFYAVVLEQPLGNGLVYRAATVSQSPQVIQKWVAEKTRPQGGEPNWEATPHATWAQAHLAVEQWMHGP
jgi:hypothetical protein